MKILVVEDDKNINKSLKKGFELEGFVVDTTEDGEEALFLIQENSYDMLILDRMLPNLNGLEICRKIRATQNTTPIIFLTAMSELEDKIEGLLDGGDDYVTKPFSFEELLARVKTVQKRFLKQDQITKTLKYEDLELDLEKRIVTRENKLINLSKKENNLLEFFIRNKGKILSKEQILKYVWEYDSDILPNTVEQYIKYLREKINKPFPSGKQYITTIRGIGYILD